MSAGVLGDHGDPFDLRRFVEAQEKIHGTALAELKTGRKRTHWMWFVFPQVQGLGNSPMAVKFSVKSREEARRYLEHPLLGVRLRECTDAVLAFEGRSALDIFGYPDDLKLKSSLTLFESVAEPGSVFGKVLEKYFQGEKDVRTLEVLQAMKT